MEFLVGIGLIVIGFLSVTVGVWISRRPISYAKLLAVFVGILLFVVLTWASFVAVVIVAAKQGHPF